MKTLEEARTQVMASLDEGSQCPCCDQYARMYKRRLPPAAIKGLLGLYSLAREDGHDYYHIKDIYETSYAKDVLNIGSIFGLCAHFGLMISEVREKDEDNLGEPVTCSGMWKITELGIDFIEGRKGIHKYILMYNGEVLGRSETFVNIDEALNHPFNYAEIFETSFYSQTNDNEEQWRGPRD